MKALTQLLVSLGILLSANFAMAQDTLSTQFDVDSIKFVEGDDGRFIAISVRNKGDFFNYPVVQVQVGDKTIANKDAIFTTYGIIDTDTFVFPCETKITENTTLTIFITDGSFGNKHKVEFEYQPE